MCDLEVVMFRLVFVLCWTTLASLGSIALSADKLSRNQVFEVQEKLNLLGFGSGKPDGLIGKKTRSAVSAFQTEYNLATTVEFNENLLGEVRNVYLENADVVFSNLEEPEFLKSELSLITIPDNYDFFVENEKLNEFHDAYGIFVEPYATLTNSAWDLPDYFDDCERAIGEFDTGWNKLEIQQRFIRCLTAYTHIHFNEPDSGIEILENILRDWASLKPVIHRGKTKLDEYNQGYAATMTLAGVAQFYAVYYDSFSFNASERRAVDQYLRNWLITEDVFSKTGYGKCNLSRIEKDFKTRDRNFDTDYCGSNRWRMALGATYLGLRLKDELLFRAGNRHVFWATSAIDKEGIYMPWARKGALALSYQRQLPEVLTFLADAYESVGFDFYEFETHNGASIKQTYSKLFEFIDDPTILDVYARAEPNFAGVSYAKFKKLPLQEQQRREMINHAILEIQSETFLREHALNAPRAHLVENWDTNWHDYIGVFVPTSGVAVSYSKKLNTSALNSAVSLPSMAKQVGNTGSFSLQCGIRITRLLDGNNDLLGEGAVSINSDSAQVTNFEWMISGLDDSDFIETHSAFAFAPDGSLVGSMALHTMFGSRSLDLVPFSGNSVLKNQGFPEGDHVAQIYDFELRVQIHNCDDLDETNKTSLPDNEHNIKTLKITWHTELRDEDYRVVLEAFDTLSYSQNFADLEISHEDISQTGIRGRDQLKYSIDDEKLRIEGLVYFGGDLINVRLNVPIEQQEYTVMFGDEDRLVISW